MDHKELLKTVVYHNNEELIILSKDMILYCNKGLKDIKELHGSNIPKELLPHIELYKHMMSTAAEFLVKTNNWYEV